MATIIKLLCVFCVLLTATAGSSARLIRNESLQEYDKATTDQQSAIKVTIATAGPMLDPPKSSYRIGEQLPITITMTNTSSQPLYACVSGDFYQDLPVLTRDGKELPFTQWQSIELRRAQGDHTCQRENLPEEILLNPNEPTLVDWLLLVDDSSLPTGAMPWYDSLKAGSYQLSIQRRIGCCDGPMVESNKISFEVGP